MHSSLLAQKMKHREGAWKKGGKKKKKAQSQLSLLKQQSQQHPLKQLPCKKIQMRGEGASFPPLFFQFSCLANTVLGECCKIWHLKRERRRCFSQAQRHRTSALIVNANHHSDKSLRHPQWKAVLTNICCQGIVEGFMQNVEMEKLIHSNKPLENMLWIWRMRFRGKKEEKRYCHQNEPYFLK